MNGAINPPAAEQRGVRCVDDGIYLQCGNVGLNGLQRCHSARKLPFRIAEIRKGIQRIFLLYPPGILPLIMNALRNLT